MRTDWHYRYKCLLCDHHEPLPPFLTTTYDVFKKYPLCQGCGNPVCINVSMAKNGTVTFVPKIQIFSMKWEPKKTEKAHWLSWAFKQFKEEGTWLTAGEGTSDIDGSTFDVKPKTPPKPPKQKPKDFTAEELESAKKFLLKATHPDTCGNADAFRLVQYIFEEVL